MFLKGFTNDETRGNFIRLAAIALGSNKPKVQTDVSQVAKSVIRVAGISVFGLAGALATGVFSGLAYGFIGRDDEKRHILNNYILEAQLKEFDLQGAMDDGLVITKMEHSELVEEIKELVTGADLKFYIEFKMLVAGLEQNDILNLMDEFIKIELKATDEIINLCDNWVMNTLFFSNYVKKELRID